MNKKVFIAMLILSVAFLVAMYVLKIFFPQEFMMSIQNENIITIGRFIDNHEWLYYVCCGVTAFITYWLYCCACKHSLYLKWYEVLYIVITIVVCRAVNFFDATIATALSYASFLFLPALMNGNIKSSAIVYIVHVLAQALSLGIRNLPIYLVDINFITTLLMTLECYFWLLLFYVVFNYRKKGANNMGLACPPLYGKSKFYANKKAKSLKKIEKLQAKITALNAVVEVCNKELAKNETK